MLSLALFWLGYPFSFGGVNQIAPGLVASSSDDISGMSIDSAGHLIVVGDFLGASIDFSPHDSMINTPRASQQNSSNEYTSDAYVARYHGEFSELLWVLTFGGEDSDVARTVATDGTGHIYVAGSFSFSMTITDTASANTNLQTSDSIATPTDDSSDGFLIKLTEAGVVVWAMTLGGTQGSDAIRAVDVDASGNVFVAGSFKGQVDFDSSDGMDANDTRTSDPDEDPSNEDAFVAAYDSSGNFLWVKRLGGDNADDEVNHVEVSGSNLLVAGVISSDTDGVQFDDNDADSEYDPAGGFPDGTETESGDIFSFVQSLSTTTGNRNWFASFLDTGTGSSESDASSISLDDSGNVYVTGYFDNVVDFDPSPTTTFNLSGTNNDDDIFIVKLNSSGTFVQARAIGSNAGDDTGDDIIVTSGMNPVIFLTGDFSGTIDPDGSGSETNTITAAGDQDALLVTFDSDLNATWSHNIGGTAYDTGDAVTANSSGDVYIGGQHKITTDLDPSPVVNSHTTEDKTQLNVDDASDGWVIKLSDSGATVPVTLLNFQVE